MVQLKYFGEFRSVNGVVWRVNIYHDTNANIPKATRLAFPADKPLEIEWTETDKLEPVQSSKATLTVISDTDREFIDLYTVEVKKIRMDIFRNGQLYWSGTLDPELYEEPFSTKKGYEVTLTFSDFSVLDRIMYNRSGFDTLQSLICNCINQSGIAISVPGQLETHISTTVNTASGIMDTVSVLNENFYDEDGEPMTYREVLENALQPFALRLLQKNGKVIVYDLNALFEEKPDGSIQTFNQKEVYWASTDAILGVDKVYNNIKLTFSPYEKLELIDAKINDSDFGTVADQEIEVHTDNSRVGSTFLNPLGFRIKLSSQQNEVLELQEGARFFHITPVYSGSESYGFATSFRPLETQYLRSVPRVFEDNRVVSKELCRIKQTPYLSYIGSKSKDYKLKLSLDVMCDVKYNPFEPDSRPNEEGNWKRLRDWCNFAYIPIMLTLRDSNGNAIYHYKNKAVMESNGFYNSGGWYAGEGRWGDAYLCYYNKGNRKSDTGLGGWKTNKPIIGYYRDGIPSYLDKLGDGEFISLPDKSGWLEFKIGTGLHQFDYKREVKDIYSRLRYMFYKNPGITIVNKYGKSLDNEDIEHVAWINAHAKEELKIETVIGTMKETKPGARGLLFNLPSSGIHQTFQRAGHRDYLEKLLIGTAYSNYAGRMNTLSGTTRLVSDFCTYKDASEPGHYIALSELQNLKENESEVRLVRFVQDDYVGIEYKQ